MRAWILRRIMYVKRSDETCCSKDLPWYSADQPMQVTIEWVRVRREASKYRYFIFLNSSVRGPFYPSYMPPGWQWTQAYTDRLVDNIKVVSSSLVCLPAVDAGGFGPKVSLQHIMKMLGVNRAYTFSDQNLFALKHILRLHLFISLRGPVQTCTC